MGVNFNSSVNASNFQTNAIQQQNPNLGINTKKVSNNLKTDVFEKLSGLDDSVMCESVIKETQDFFGRSVKYKGSINNKAINLNEKTDGVTIFANHTVQGTIGDKEIQIDYNRQSFSGAYNGCNFDLKFENGNLIDMFIGSRKISGTINGEPIQIDFKNSEIPQDENVQDIITTFLMINGIAAKVKDGHFVGTKNSNWYQKQQDEMMAAAMMSQTMQTNSYTPTWHYDNPMAPVYY